LPEYLSQGTEKEFISLRYAARKLYDKALAENKLLAGAAERSGSLNAGLTPASPDETLNFLAMRIAEYIPVFGRKDASPLLSRIEKSDINESSFRDGASALKHHMHPRAIYWNNLAVKKQDFDTQLSRMLA
jgi:hypothetical protein